MKKIAITLIGLLIALYLVVYRPWRTAGQGEKDSAGGLNVAQDNNRPVTSANDVKQPAKAVQQPVKKENKQRVTNAQGAKRHGKGARRPMTGRRQDVKQRGSEFERRVVETRVYYDANGCAALRCEDPELQVVETPGHKQVIIDVRRPTDGVKAVYLDVQEQSVEPVDVEYMEVQGQSVEPVDVEYVESSSAWEPAREIYLAAPERQECPTPFEVRVELRVR